MIDHPGYARTALIVALATACVVPYNGRFHPLPVLDPTVSDLDPTIVPDREKEIRDNWRRVNSVCNQVRPRMVTERDQIEIHDKAIGAIFVGITAALSVSGAVYGIVADAPDHKIAAVLSLGAGVSTVPAFFYFGSDDRQKIVDARIKEVDDARQAVINAYEVAKSAQREIDATARGGDADDASKDREAQARKHAAIDTLDTALLALEQACR